MHELTHTSEAQSAHPKVCTQQYISALPTLDPVGNLEFQMCILQMIGTEDAEDHN